MKVESRLMATLSAGTAGQLVVGNVLTCGERPDRAAAHLGRRDRGVHRDDHTAILFNGCSIGTQPQAQADSNNAVWL
jgi:hypothetical protein